MNKLKGFILENKQYIMLIGSVLAGIFLVFTVIAVIISSKGRGGSSEKSTTTKYVANQSREDSTTDKTGEADTTEETVGMQEETTTDEQATEPETVNPNTLPYKISVNRAANCITVYGKDSEGKFTVPVKAITCSTGKEIGDTPAGTFTTLVSYNWLLMVDGSYGQYAYRFYGPILFHSVPYFSKNKGDLEWEQYNKLGEAASLGCVRTTVADAIWLIKNCPIGTYVEVYDDAGNPGPLGKPETIKIPSDSPNRGWDPTDPDENNPWHKCSPEIKVNNKKVSIVKGSSAEKLLKSLGAKGYDTCGNQVTSKIKITGIEFDKVGIYRNVKLNLTDAIGKTAEEIVVTVEVTEPETTTNNKTDKETEDVSDDSTSTGNETTSDETKESEITSDNTDETTSETINNDETTSDEATSEETTTPQEEVTTENVTSEDRTTP